MTHVLFALGYGLPPFFFALADHLGAEYGPYYSRPLFSLQYFNLLSLDTAVHVRASLYAFVSVACIFAGYRISVHWSSRSSRTWLPPIASIGAGRLAVAGGVFLAVSLAAMIVYANQFDSPMEMLNLSRKIRSGRVPVQMGFLQIVVSLALPATMFLAAAGVRSSGRIKTLLFALAGVAWGVLMIRTYHAAGRMVFFTALSFIPLACVCFWGIRDRRSQVIGSLLVLGALGAILSPQSFFDNPAQGLSELVGALSERFTKSALFVLNEFAFPYVVSARTLTLVPDTVGYRYFVDFPLTILYLLPSLSSADSWPPLTAHLHLANQAVFGNDAIQRMPIDFISFGIYNVGFAGVLISSVGFGFLTGLIERWLCDSRDFLTALLRAGWMLYLPFFILYATPYTAAKTGFGLVVGTLAVIALVFRVSRDHRSE